VSLASLGQTATGMLSQGPGNTTPACGLAGKVQLRERMAALLTPISTAVDSYPSFLHQHASHLTKLLLHRLLLDPATVGESYDMLGKWLSLFLLIPALAAVPIASFVYALCLHTRSLVRGK